MKQIEPETLARAWNWIVRRMRQHPEADLQRLLQQASRRYHLDPNEQRWLLHQLQVGLFAWSDGPGTLAWSERVH